MRSLRRPPIGRTLKSAGRLQKIVSVFAKHGFQDVAERVKLLSPFPGKSAGKKVSRKSMALRLRQAFEELGPTFVKLGQLLATRPDLVPEDFVQEFSHLHHEVLPLSIDEVKSVIEAEIGKAEEIFAEFDEQPLGSASIAQVHRATLSGGEEVVVKVQRPHIVETIQNDMSILFFIAELLEMYVSETKPYNPVAIVEEFYRTLDLETNFIVEGNNIRRFLENFKNEEDIVIPEVYWPLTTERVLVMQALNGVPLSAVESDAEFNRETVVRRGLKCFFKMVFKDGLFHGDLHAGNFFILPSDRIGLVDFGVVGRLSSRTQAAIANILVALAEEDYDRVAFEYLEVAPFNELTDPDKFARQLRETTAPYFGLSLKNINAGKLLMSTAGVAAENHVMVPVELMLYFKSVVAIEGLGRRIIKDFDFLELALEFAVELAADRYDPAKMARQSGAMMRDSAALMSELPRQLRLLVRRVSQPGFAIRHRIDRTEDLVRSIEHLSHLVFLGIVIGSLLIGSSLLVATSPQPIWLGLPALGLIGFIIATVLSLVSVYQYLKK